MTALHPVALYIWSGKLTIIFVQVLGRVLNSCCPLSLSLYHMDMDKLPEEIVSYRGLEHLQIYKTGLKILPGGPYLTTLLTIDIDDNDLREIAEEVFHAPRLCSLKRCEHFSTRFSYALRLYSLQEDDSIFSIWMFWHLSVLNVINDYLHLKDQRRVASSSVVERCL